MPELKQSGDLYPADLDRHPAWVSCHGADDGLPWYDATDEGTFRPFTGALPVSQANGMFLVRATFELRVGSRLRGFLTPAFHEADLGVLSPAKVQRGARARDRSCGRLGRRVLSRITGNPGRILNEHPNAKEK
jgi:hypothetical protein